jgi:biopolymer transport protein TolR
MARRKLQAEINVVPYIDVMLVLLVIFMITAPLLSQGIEVDLPKTQAENISASQEPTTVSVDRQGRYYLNRGEKTTEPLSEEELRRRVDILVRANPDNLILVEGDGRAQYESVARAMAVLQSAGVMKIGFVTQPRDLPAR